MEKEHRKIVAYICGGHVKNRCCPICGHIVDLGQPLPWESFWIPYGLLSEETKEDDRKWARKALKIVRKADTFLPRKGRKIEVKND